MGIVFFQLHYWIVSLLHYLLTQTNTFFPCFMNRVQNICIDNAIETTAKRDRGSDREREKEKKNDRKKYLVFCNRNRFVAFFAHKFIQRFVCLCCYLVGCERSGWPESCSLPLKAHATTVFGLQDLSQSLISTRRIHNETIDTSKTISFFCLRFVFKQKCESIVYTFYYWLDITWKNSIRNIQ